MKELNFKNTNKNVCALNDYLTSNSLKCVALIHDRQYGKNSEIIKEAENIKIIVADNDVTKATQIMNDFLNSSYFPIPTPQPTPLEQAQADIYLGVFNNAVVKSALDDANSAIAALKTRVGILEGK